MNPNRSPRDQPMAPPTFTPMKIRNFISVKKA
jgi:hypothetical protein